MNAIRIFAIVVMATALAAVSTGAGAVTVDFAKNFGRALGDNDAIGRFDFGDGLTGSLTVFGGIGEARVLDTRSGSKGTKNDPDLKGPFRNVDDKKDRREFGNALIIQENRTGGADDNAGGGRIVFTFDNTIDLLSLVFLDGEEGATVTVDGAQVGNRARGEDRKFDIIQPRGEVVRARDKDRMFDITDTNGLASGILSFTVNFGGSGAIGEFTANAAPPGGATAVPLPATLPLALGAIGGLAFLARRRKSQN